MYMRRVDGVTAAAVLGLVGGAPGWRHRASPIHRPGERANLLICCYGARTSGREPICGPLVSYGPLAASIEFSAQEERREACVRRGVDYHSS